MARPREFDEADVIEAARAQFWHNGYENTSVAQLCDATGLASQSLYGAFGSKHELFIRTLGGYCARQLAGLAQSEAAAPDPWRWLMAAVTFEDTGRLAPTGDGCYLSNSASALARLDDEVRDAYRSTFGAILEVFATALERARTLGQLRAEVVTADAAYSLLTAMQGLEFLSKAGIPAEQYERAKASTVATLTRALAPS